MYTKQSSVNDNFFNVVLYTVFKYVRNHCARAPQDFVSLSYGYKNPI